MRRAGLRQRPRARDADAAPLAETPAGFGSDNGTPAPDDEPPLTTWSVAVGWAPYALMSLLLLLTGLVRQQEQHGPVHMGPLQTKYAIPIYDLHNQSHRDLKLVPMGTESKPEKAEFDFAWLTAPGSAVFAAALVSMVMLRMSGSQIRRVFQRTFFQMRIPIPTIACMLGLSYVTRYAGLDATLGVAFAETGPLYPFFAAILGWLGVFLTGTDAGSNCAVRQSATDHGYRGLQGRVVSAFEPDSGSGSDLYGEQYGRRHGQND